MEDEADLNQFDGIMKHAVKILRRFVSGRVEADCVCGFHLEGGKREEITEQFYRHLADRPSNTLSQRK